MDAQIQCRAESGANVTDEQPLRRPVRSHPGRDATRSLVEKHHSLVQIDQDTESSGPISRSFCVVARPDVVVARGPPDSVDDHQQQDKRESGYSEKQEHPRTMFKCL